MPKIAAQAAHQKKLLEWAAIVRQTALDGEEVILAIGCKKEGACRNCARKWRMIIGLREAADFLESQARVH